MLNLNNWHKKHHHYVSIYFSGLLMFCVSFISAQKTGIFFTSHSSDEEKCMENQGTSSDKYNS